MTPASDGTYLTGLISMSPLRRSQSQATGLPVSVIGLLHTLGIVVLPSLSWSSA